MVAFDFRSGSSLHLARRSEDKKKRGEFWLFPLEASANFPIGVVSRLDGWVVKDYASSRDMETKTPAETSPRF